jgi:hypothetical protein
MTDHQPEPEGSGCLTIALGVAGVVLLLPGVCSLYFAPLAALERDWQARLPWVLFLWLPSFISVALGVWLIIRALRR